MKVPRSRRRGKSHIFQVNDFRAIGRAKIIRTEKPMNAKIIRFIHDAYRTAPLMEVKFEDGASTLLPAFGGAYVGKIITYLKEGEINDGDIKMLKDMPPGTDVYNIELKPGDGGKLVRAGGMSAKIIESVENKTTLSLPSNASITLDPKCRAIIGKVANGGRTEKPFYKAGNKYHLIRARGRYWPMNAAVAMNAYEHKFGGKRRSTQHKAKTSSRRAPPGAKAGAIAPRRTGVR
ncbi:50S ribosomal protein L2 [Candidatus Parvarchaeota archaeon]|nr:50S ribosomal protein L2 [Candidatus Parvarchaeota archaeon]